MIDRIIVALDVPNAVTAIQLASKLEAAGITKVKIGMELFSAEGPRIVTLLRDCFGFDIMLDLKLHDIPATVGRTVAHLRDLNVWGITVHIGGGAEMLRAATIPFRGYPWDDKAGIIGVTVLTSLDQQGLKEVGVDMSPQEAVLHRAVLATDYGVRSIVASPHEAALLSASLPRKTFIITPGIRPGLKDGYREEDDQKRTRTPAEAIRAGATHLVIGRPIREAPDPVEAVKAIVAEMVGAV